MTGRHTEVEDQREVATAQVSRFFKQKRFKKPLLVDGDARDVNELGNALLHLQLANNHFWCSALCYALCRGLTLDSSDRANMATVRWQKVLVS